MADLAQAPLQSSLQFHTATGEHHHKMPSFTLPTMLLIVPNIMAMNVMDLGLSSSIFGSSSSSTHQETEEALTNVYILLKLIQFQQ